MRFESGSSINIESDPRRLPEIRRGVSAFGLQSGLSEDDVHCLVFAVNEAVSNAIEHGKAFPDGTVEIWAEANSERVRVAVTDCGVFGPPSYSSDDRGRGLLMCRQMIDDVDVQSRPGGTVVVLTQLLALHLS